MSYYEDDEVVDLHPREAVIFFSLDSGRFSQEDAEDKETPVPILAWRETTPRLLRQLLQEVRRLSSHSNMTELFESTFVRD
ncbi:MAG: hypothetical protein AAGC55_07090 [Myxococcota bacterium]